MIELPFPPPVLSPNARKHWGAQARAFKAYKTACYLVLSQWRKHLLGRDKFIVTFRPPDRHRRDTDNMIAAIKAALDALSMVSGVDDSQFTVTYRRDEPVKGGAVIVEAA